MNHDAAGRPKKAKSRKKKAKSARYKARADQSAWRKSGASDWSAPLTSVNDTTKLMSQICNVIRHALREEDKTVVSGRKTDKTAFMVVVIYHVKGIEFSSATLHTAFDKAYLKVKGYELTFFKKELKQKLLELLEEIPDLFHLPTA